MSAEGWEEVGRLFTAALELDEREREGFVRHSASTPEVAEDVASLLRAHLRTGLFDRVGVAGDRPSPLEPGTRVGAWEIVGELGRGGEEIGRSHGRCGC